jgi:hypothetical protein
MTTVKQDLPITGEHQELVEIPTSNFVKDIDNAENTQSPRMLTPPAIPSTSSVGWQTPFRDI